MLRLLNRWSARSLLLASALVLFLAPTAAPAAVQAAGPAPILLIVNDAYGANPFGRYLGEILRAEGLNAYDVITLDTLAAGDLSAHKVAILAETTLTAPQATLLTDYVTGGGRLIAMRPDAQITALFGLGAAAGTQTDGYLKFETNQAPAAGLTASALQIHGTADKYALSGGTAVALLYSDRTTPTVYPAVVLGTTGRVAAFTYDLARNIVLTRQGNPANANLDTDDDGVTRTIDLFITSPVTTAVPWIDRELIPVPQADEQMRLLARLVQAQLTPQLPLPQLWYFPGTAKTVLVLTGDAHANAQQQYQNEINSLASRDATITLYITEGGYLSDDLAGGPLQALTWSAQGHDFGIHPYGASDGTTLTDSYAAYVTWFGATFPGVPLSRTVRNHKVAWEGWTSAAEIAAGHGIALDTNFYHWGRWLQKADGTWPHGYITGSGQPMRFVRADGTVLPIYQQLTQLVDEQFIGSIGDTVPRSDGWEQLDGDQALIVTRQQIDASLAGDYAALMAQFHVDYYDYPSARTWAEGTVDYARANNVPIYNADQWLTFTEVRSGANFTDLSWSAATRTLSFTQVATATSGVSLTVMLPLTYEGYGLQTVTVDGSPAAFSQQTIKGQKVAFVTLASGSRAVTAAYTGPLPDGTATQSTYAELNPGCAVQANTHVSDLNGGALSLSGTLADQFAGASLNAGLWNTGAWPTGPYSPTVNAGRLTLPGGGWVASTVTHGRGMAEAWVEFGSGTSQAFGYAEPNFATHYFLFSTYNPDGPYDGNLRARVRAGGAEQKVNLGAIPTGLHRYRVEWSLVSGSADRIRFYIDGVLVAEFDISNDAVPTMPLYFSNDGLADLNVDAVNESPDYVGAGTYTSCVFDAGVDYAWQTVSWSATVTATTALTVEAKTSFDGSAWSDWTVVASNGGALGRPARYAQYRLSLATNATTQSPVVDAVTLGYGAGLASLAKSDGRTSATLGETVAFTLSVSVPQTTTYSLLVTDTLPAGYAFNPAHVAVTGVTVAPTFTTAGPTDGSAPVTLKWDFGNAVATTDTVRMVYTATVANVSSNQQGVVLNNTFTATYKNSLGAQQAGVNGAEALTLAEPVLSAAKSIVAANAHAGGSLTYRVVITHPGGANTSPAFDAKLIDTLPSTLALVSGAVSVTSTGPVTLTGTSLVGNVLTVDIAAFAAGGSVTVEYTPTLDSDVLIGQVISNTAVIVWSSQPGAVTQERNGGGDSLNDYRLQRSVSQVAQGAQFALQVDEGGAVAYAGQPVTYTVTYKNTGNYAAGGVTVTTTVPVDTTFASAASSPGWSCQSGGLPGALCTYTVGALAPDASGALTFVVLVDPATALSAVGLNATVSAPAALTVTAGDTTPLGLRSVYLPFLARLP